VTDPINMLKDAGYHVVTDRPISKRLRQFTLMTKHFAAYQDPLIIRLMNDAQLRKGKALTAKQIINAIKPGQDSERFIQQATSISQVSLQRGYTLTCPACMLTDWYPLPNLMTSEAPRCDLFKCRGCYQSILLPFDAQFEYKLNSLVREAVINGGLTLLNALVYLTHSRHHTYTWHTAVEVKNRHLHTDIDLLLFDKDSGLLVECKDNFQTSDTALETLKQTIDTGLKLAKTLDYGYVFATLQDDVPAAISKQVEQGSRRVLTSRDLLTS
jgi:hypothetical protein